MNANLPPISRVTTVRPVPAPAPPVRRVGSAGGDDPIPVAVSALSFPAGMSLTPGAAGAFESVLRHHKISAAAAQALADVHFKHLRDEAERYRSAWNQRLATERDGYMNRPGSRQKLASATDLMTRYEKACGKEARAAVAKVLQDTGAGNCGPMIDLIAFAADPSRYGGASRGERRYNVGRAND